MKLSAIVLCTVLSSSSAFIPTNRAFQSSALQPLRSSFDEYQKDLTAAEGLQGGPEFVGQAGPLALATVHDANTVWDSLTPVLCQGGSLKTWSFQSAAVSRVQVLLKTEGRPCHANVDLWQGPDNTPQKMKVYLEDGDERPFNCVVETPGDINTVAIRNIGDLEFPLAGGVKAEVEDVDGSGLASLTQSLLADASVKEELCQGGALKTYAFNYSVDQIQIFVTTDGRPMNVRIELLQGPNNIKQAIEIYSEDGLIRPFFGMFNIPGGGNVIRVKNESPMEYPMMVKARGVE